MTPKRPLTVRAQHFAEVWNGDGVAAARAAGYSGDAATLASQASKLLDDPRVLAVIRARGLTPPPRHVRGGKGAGRGGGRLRRERARERAEAASEAEDEVLLDAGPAEPACEHCGQPAAGTDRRRTMETLRAMRSDAEALPRDRQRAMELLERIQRQIAAEMKAARGGDPLQQLQTKLAAVLKAKRERGE